MYSEIFELHAELLGAMASPKRLEIIQLLRDQELNVGQMQQMLGLPQANLSQHLMVLRGAGVVARNKRGKEVYYQLAHDNFIKASDLVREVLVENTQDDELLRKLTLKMKDLVPVVKDLVCGMRVSPKTAAAMSRYKGRVFYFCATGCKVSFDKNPERFIN